jgi:hypothetical protein
MNFVLFFSNENPLKKLPSGARDLHMYDNLFSPLKQLRYLNLANCSFVVLPLDIFANNTKLTELR